MDRERCPFCLSAKTPIDTGIELWDKPGVGFPIVDSARIVECIDCRGEYTDRVPDPDAFTRLYVAEYIEQTAGLKRFIRDYGHVRFQAPVLEIGPGAVGIRAQCDGPYYTCEFRHDADFRAPFETLSDADIERVKSLGIETIVTCDCIEHVLDPRAFFAVATQILPMGGSFYVQFGELKPDEYGTSRPRPLQRQAAHINCPSLTSVKALMGRELVSVVEGCPPHGSSGWVMQKV